MEKRTKVDPEPTWGDKPSHTIVEAINWYNINKDEKDAAKYLGIREGTLAKNFSTLAWTRRMKQLGCVFPEKEAQTIAEMQELLNQKLQALKPAVPTGTTNVVSIQERVQEKVDYYIMELEAKFDDLHFHQSKEDFDSYAWMVEQGVKPMHAAKIGAYFRERAKEMVGVIEGMKTDEYIKESYSRPRKQYVHAANILLLFATDAEKIASNASKARAPRKKKPVSIERKVKNLKYLDRFDDLKLQSISPSKIPGAMQLWVYNTKTRQLGVYNAMDDSGLDVKGASIANYSFETSIGKTLRKPKDTLKIVTDGGKIALRKVLDNINSIPKALNGRVNKDIVLLRVL